MSKRKIRADFRKNRSTRQRETDRTRRFDRESIEDADEPRQERISGKGELTRRRTVVGTEIEQGTGGFAVQPDVDLSQCLPGRVLVVHGLLSIVQAAEGTFFRCATRRLLKTLSTDQRHVVAAGDRVLFRPADAKAGGNISAAEAVAEGFIERIEPRRSALSRTVRGRQHVIVTNVDQMVIVSSAAEPRLKPGLIDRYIVSAEKRPLAPNRLHQQSRSGGSSRSRAAGRRLQPHGIPRAAGLCHHRLRHRSLAPRTGRPGQRGGRAKAAWENRRC